MPGGGVRHSLSSKAEPRAKFIAAGRSFLVSRVLSFAEDEFFRLRRSLGRVADNFQGSGDIGGRGEAGRYFSTLSWLSPGAMCLGDSIPTSTGWMKG